MPAKFSRQIEKPRPEAATFETVIGHPRAVAYLREAQVRGRLPQSILFDGPPGVGKSAMAYALAKTLLAGGEESGEAFEAHARKVAAEPMSHPDLKILGPSGAAGQIRVESVRDAQDTLHQMPLEGARRVLVIDPADRLNPSSANSLLKLIEEPPASLSIILATESVHTILPTIRSRATRLRLQAIDPAAISQWLVDGFGASAEEARAAALFSGGGPGQALEMLGGQALTDRDTLIEEWRFFQKHGFRALFRVAYNLAKIGQPLEGVLGAWTAWVRDATVAASTPGRSDLLLNRDRAEDLAAEASRYGVRALGRCLEFLLEARRDARRMVNRQLFFEVLLLRLGPELKRGGA